MEHMHEAADAALPVLVFSAGGASAQGTLTVGQPVDRATTAGATQEFTIALDAGDYVAGALAVSSQRWPRRSSQFLTPIV